MSYLTLCPGDLQHLLTRFQEAKALPFRFYLRGHAPLRIELRGIPFVPDFLIPELGLRPVTDGGHLLLHLEINPVLGKVIGGSAAVLRFLGVKLRKDLIELLPGNILRIDLHRVPLGEGRTLGSVLIVESIHMAPAGLLMQFHTIREA